jgi:hypothetical protein
MLRKEVDDSTGDLRREGDQGEGREDTILFLFFG